MKMRELLSEKSPPSPIVEEITPAKFPQIGKILVIGLKSCLFLGALAALALPLICLAIFWETPSEDSACS